jgi:hypothetical protein
MWLCFDLECENKPYLGAVASPFCPDNYIVAPGWAIDGGPVQHRYFNNRAEADASDWAEVALKDATIAVAHNATFEIHWMMHRHKDTFLAFLKRGGRIFCTQYAQYMLSMQQETYPSLEDTAQNYGGSMKIDEVKLLWEQGALTSEIDQALLIKYLVGNDEMHGDIGNTRLSCFAQYALLEQRGMLAAFWQRMDSLLFNAISTFNGMYVNMEVGRRNHGAQLEEVVAIEKELLGSFPTDMPAELVFNYGSRRHMSGWLFGGPVKYEMQVPYDPIQYVKGDFYKVEDAEGTLVPVELAEQYLKEGQPHNYVLYKSGKNKGMTKVFREDTKVEKTKIGEGVYTFPGLIDLTTLPPHVSGEYLGRRATYRGSEFMCDRKVDEFGNVLVEGTPVYSTSGESIDLLGTFVEAVKPLKKLAQLNKDNGTYYQHIEYNKSGGIKKESGMFQFVGPDGIVHHELNACASITGRLSSSKPNLQNLPREGTSVVKEMFESRFGPNGRIVEVDYTALEVVDAAAITNDKALLKELMAGTDMHCLRLATKLKRLYVEVRAIFLDEHHPDHKAIKYARTNIKTPSFAAQYGASAQGISFATGLPLEEAEEFLRIDQGLFPEMYAYRTYIREVVESTGALPEAVHREMNDDGSWSVYRIGFFPAKSGNRYAFRQKSQWDSVAKKRIMDYKNTELANYLFQGEASFIVQCSCGRVVRWLIENDFFGGCVLPINTVHDAIYLDCVDEEWAIYAGKMVAYLMGDTPRWMCETMPALREWRYDTVPFPAAAEQGPNMMTKSHC